MSNNMNHPEEKPLALVAEDEVDLAEVFAIALEAAGFRTLVATNGRFAEELLSKQTPDVVLLDLHLPHIMGESLLHQIRSNPALAKTAVILATADSRRASFLQDQADFVLLKPISFRQLRGLMQRVRQQILNQTLLPKPDTAPIHPHTGLLGS